MSEGMSPDFSALGRRPRIAVLFDRLGPYHHARLRAAAEQAEIIAIEMSDVDHIYAWDKVDRASAFSQFTLFGEHDAARASIHGVLARLSKVLHAVEPDAVAVPGWADKGALAGLAWCAANRTPAIVMSASTRHDYERRMWKELLKRQILRLSSAALAGGQAQADYLVDLGVARDRISVGYDVVDNTHFAQGAANARANEAYFRKNLSLPQHYFMTTSRFVRKKNLARLLEAYAAYTRLAGDQKWGLVLLGDGAERASVESDIVRLGISDLVVLPGFKQYDELPAYYGLADCFVLASLSEQWGLVVNEAMASGLPVLVSRHCGCAPDLVREGVNGFTFDPQDVMVLASLMARIAAVDCDRAAMSAASLDRIAHWSPARFSSGLLQAARCAGVGS